MKEKQEERDKQLQILESMKKKLKTGQKLLQNQYQKLVDALQVKEARDAPKLLTQSGGKEKTLTQY